MEGLSISQFSEICRVCVKKGELHPIFNYKDQVRPEEVNDLSIKIRLCANIVLATGDGLPSNICKDCINLLIMAHHFKVSSEYSDRILREIFNKENQCCDFIPSSPIYKSDVIKEERIESSSPDILLKDIKKVSFKPKKLRKIRVKKSSVSSKLKESRKTKCMVVSCDAVIDQIANIDSAQGIKFENKDEAMNLRSCDDLFHDDNISYSDTGEENNTKLRKDALKSDDDFDLRANFMDDFYGCLECKRHFPTKVILHKHMAEEHGSIKKEYKCYGCGSMFATKYKRSEHERTKCPRMPPGTKYQCRECDTTQDTRKDFDLHIRRHRTALAAPRANTLELGPLFPCPHCPKTLATHGSLYTHIQNHSKQDLICEICGKCFKTRIRLMCHIKLHANYKAFSCKECDFRTSTRNSLFLHTRKHSGERPYSCEVCGKLTATKSNLNSHRKRHTGVKDYKCDICGKSYVDKPPLEEHIMAVHAGLRPHGCPHCGATYTRKTGLRRHIKKRHPKGS